MNKDLRIAFVQDAMLFQGGADKVVAAALEVFPQAPIFTLVHTPEPYEGQCSRTILFNLPSSTIFRAPISTTVSIFLSCPWRLNNLT